MITKLNGSMSILRCLIRLSSTSRYSMPSCVSRCLTALAGDGESLKARGAQPIRRAEASEPVLAGDGRGHRAVCFLGFTVEISANRTVSLSNSNFPYVRGSFARLSGFDALVKDGSVEGHGKRQRALGVEARPHAAEVVHLRAGERLQEISLGGERKQKAQRTAVSRWRAATGTPPRSGRPVLPRAGCVPPDRAGAAGRRRPVRCTAPSPCPVRRRRAASARGSLRSCRRVWPAASTVVRGRPAPEPREGSRPGVYFRQTPEWPRRPSDSPRSPDRIRAPPRVFRRSYRGSGPASRLDRAAPIRPFNTTSCACTSSLSAAIGAAWPYSVSRRIASPRRPSDCAHLARLKSIAGFFRSPACNCFICVQSASAGTATSRPRHRRTGGRCHGPAGSRR